MVNCAILDNEKKKKVQKRLGQFDKEQFTTPGERIEAMKALLKRFDMPTDIFDKKRVNNEDDLFRCFI